MDKEFGCTPELRNYIIKNPTDAKFSQIDKHVRAFNNEKQNVQAAVKVLDVYYHRGTNQNRVIVSDPSVNENQVEMTQAI